MNSAAVVDGSREAMLTGDEMTSAAAVSEVFMFRSWQTLILSLFVSCPMSSSLLIPCCGGRCAGKRCCSRKMSERYNRASIQCINAHLLTTSSTGTTCAFRLCSERLRVERAIQTKHITASGGAFCPLTTSIVDCVIKGAPLPVACSTLLRTRRTPAEIEH